ncbi:MAG: hypothetical protein ACYC46_14790 [Acidobacteriaceae bacterium]
MKLIGKLTVLALLLVWGSSPVWAVPSFARQTGLACNVCHYDPPELTPFGRIFKLSGYSLIDAAKANTVGDGKTLQLLRVLPLSVMFLVSDTALQTKQPGTQNGTVEFPQQLSLFLAGEMAPHFGLMAQATYDHQSDHFTMDNTDIRFANRTKLKDKDLLYGVTLNNNPTVEDPWNSTPAWGFPYISADQTPGSIAAPVIDGGLAQDVGGAGGYAMWNNHLYGDVTLYRSEHAGGSAPADGSGFGYNISGVAPYWRLAWQQNIGKNYLEVGTYGIYMNSFPGAVSGAEDRYVDPSFDFTFQRPMGANALSVHGTYIHEKSNMDATFQAGGADLAQHTLDLGRADATYYWGNKYSATASFFTIAGTNDATLYAPGDVTGSRTGSPNTTGYILQGSYWPVQNIDMSIAYDGFSHFNGSGQNYDGSGRNASDNNTVYLAVWFNY